MSTGKRRIRLPLMALAVTVVIAAGAYLRLRGLQHGWMGGDQSVLLGIALRFVNGGPLPLTANKASAGVMNPPLLEYLLALPLFVKQDILWVVGFLALLSVLSVGVCYWVVARLAGPRAGLIATILYAVSPWAVHYSRFIWNPNPIPFFSMLLLGFLLLYFADRRRPAYLVLSFVWLAAIVQLHLGSLVLVAAVGLILLLFWRRVTLWHVLLGCALFLITFVPYFLYLRLSGFVDVKALFGTLGGQQVTFSPASALIVRDLATGNGIFRWLGAGEAAWREAVWPFFSLARVEGWLLAASALYACGHVLVGGVGDLIRKQKASTRTVMFLILLLWLLVPTALYFRHTVYLQNYYFLYIYPAPFILIGLAMDDAFRRIQTWVRRQSARWLKPLSTVVGVILLGIILTIAVWQFQVSHVRMNLADQGVVDGWRVEDMRQLTAAARKVMTAHPGCSLVVISEGHRPEASTFGFLADAGISPDVRYVTDGAGFIVPEGCAIYLDTAEGGWVQTWLDGQASELTEDRVDTGKTTWRFYHKPDGVIPPGWVGRQPLGEWVGGLLLVDSQVRGTITPGGTFELLLAWKTTGTPEEGRLYHFYNHLARQEDGRPVAQADGPGVYTPYWRVGGFFATRFLIAVPQDVPAGPYQIRVGLYGWPDSQRMLLTDGSDGLVVLNLTLLSAR